MSRTFVTIISAGVVAIALILAGLALPNWLLFTMTRAMAFGLVALGIISLMRGGLVSFGQGLVYCLGAYASGLAATRLGITDITVLVAIGGLAGVAAAGLLGPLIARYRGIFFAMLTLAMSMVLFGVLAKMTMIGGSDGFNVPEPTFFGYLPDVSNADYALYCFSVLLSAAAAVLCLLYFSSMPGLIALAVRENELRVDYLGASVFAVTVRNFMIAGFLGGVGGALNGFALGHVDPYFSYWTTSGEFVFIAILAGHVSVGAAFIAALVTELVRSFSNQYFPEMWQLLLGGFLLLVILFVPNGIGSLWAHLGHFRRGKDKRQTRVTGSMAEEAAE
jgi:ABC-type branched-subunit amino acid transport system permease subunit